MFFIPVSVLLIENRSYIDIGMHTVCHLTIKDTLLPDKAKPYYGSLMLFMSDVN
jgi:hypothetical protein